MLKQLLKASLVITGSLVLAGCDLDEPMVSTGYQTGSAPKAASVGHQVSSVPAPAPAPAPAAPASMGYQVGSTPQAPAASGGFQAN